MFPYGFKYLSCYFDVWCVKMGKIRLFVRTRKGNKGSYIASVPLQQLVKFSGYDKTRWFFKDGWLILEAF